MRKIWMVTAVLLGGSALMRAQTSGTVKDDLFAGTEKFAANASSVTEVDMDPDSMGLVSGSNSARARRTVLSVVHTYEYEKPGMYNIADVDAFRNKLNTGDWHCSVHVRELKSGESTDVCRKHRTDGLEESAIITVEPKSLTFIHTIKRPATDGKPGGGESFLMAPFETPSFDGMPSSAWGAEMRANAAQMRAQGAITRAEMAAIRPEMVEQMAEMRASMAGMLPGGPMSFYSKDGGARWVRELSPLDAQQMKDLTKVLKDVPDRIVLEPAIPGTPAVPLYREPAPPSAPAKP